MCKKIWNVLPANWEDDDVIVEHHANNEDTEAEQLKSKEVLPSHANAVKGTKNILTFDVFVKFSPDHPDHKGPDTVKHHAGGGWQLFGDTNAGKVEEGDRDDGASEGKCKQRIVRELVATVIGIFQHMSWSMAKLIPNLWGDILYSLRREENKPQWRKTEWEGEQESWIQMYLNKEFTFSVSQVFLPSQPTAWSAGTLYFVMNFSS